MALGVLGIIYMAIIAIVVVLHILLYKSKSESQNTVLIMNMLLAVALSFIVFTSLPMNWTGQRILSVVWGVISVLAVVINLKFNKLMVSKVMLSIAIAGNLAQLFF